MKKVFLSLALCLATSGLFAQEADPAQLKNEGTKAYQEKNYAVAFTKYSEYLKQNNYQDTAVIFNCGLAADKAKKPAEAVKLFDKTIQLKYRLADSYISKAGSLKDLNKNAEYIATLEEGLEAVPNNATLEKMYAVYYVKEGQKYQKTNNIPKATEAFEKASKVNSKIWKGNAEYSLGVLYFNNGANTLKKAASLATTNPDKYAQQKEAAHTDFQKATQYLEEASQLLPQKSADIQKLLGQVKAAMK